MGALIAELMPVYCVKVDKAHLKTCGMTRSKNGLIWSNISGSTGPIFAIFTPYERALHADDGSVAFFPIY